MISVLTWLWGDAYKPEHVNALRRQVARHYSRPHRFMCLTSFPFREYFDRDVEVVQFLDGWPLGDVPSPHGSRWPSCYRRLMMFQADIGNLLGERFVSIDLDAVIVRDMAPVWDRDEDIVLWRDPLFPQQYNGSMVLMTAGARPHVWQEFDRRSAPGTALAAGFRGSDQGWISYCLPGESTWGASDGVMSYRKHAANGLPKDARIVFFHGRPKQWETPIAPWVREHWTSWKPENSAVA